MFKFMLSVALGLASVSCFAHAEPPQSPVTLLASSEASNPQIIEGYPSNGAAQADGKYYVAAGLASSYMVYRRENTYALYLFK